MNPEIKAKWVAALRSGKYRQGQDHLVHGGAYCCLGVLCDLYAQEHDLEFHEGTREDFCAKSSVSPGGFTEMPSDVIVDWSGLEVRDPYLWVNENEEGPITGLNDTGTPFSTLADLIEAQL